MWNAVHDCRSNWGAFSSWNANWHRYNHLKGATLHTRQDERVNPADKPMRAVVLLLLRHQIFLSMPLKPVAILCAVVYNLLQCGRYGGWGWTGCSSSWALRCMVSVSAQWHRFTSSPPTQRWRILAIWQCPLRSVHCVHACVNVKVVAWELQESVLPGILKALMASFAAVWCPSASPVTRPTPVFSVLRFPLTIIHGCGRVVKNAEGLVSFITWVTSGGRKGGRKGGGARSRFSRSWKLFIIQLARFERSASSQDSQTIYTTSSAVLNLFAVAPPPPPPPPPHVHLT